MCGRKTSTEISLVSLSHSNSNSYPVNNGLLEYLGLQRYYWGVAELRTWNNWPRGIQVTKFSLVPLLHSSITTLSHKLEPHHEQAMELNTIKWGSFSNSSHASKLLTVGHLPKAKLHYLLLSFGSILEFDQNKWLLIRSMKSWRQIISYVNSEIWKTTITGHPALCHFDCWPILWCFLSLLKTTGLRLPCELSVLN